MKIIFMRHGKINLKTGKLSLEGIFQVRNARQYLKDEKIDAIFCSPQTRGIQSAEIINKKIKAPIHIIKEFHSRRHLNMDQLEYEKEYRENYFNYAYKSKHFETCKQFVDNVISGYKDCLKLVSKPETIMIIANNSTLYALSAFFNGIPEDKQIKWIQCSNGAVIKFMV